MRVVGQQHNWRGKTRGIIRQHVTNRNDSVQTTVVRVLFSEKCFMCRDWTPKRFSIVQSACSFSERCFMCRLLRKVSRLFSKNVMFPVFPVNYCTGVRCYAASYSSWLFPQMCVKFPILPPYCTSYYCSRTNKIRIHRHEPTKLLNRCGQHADIAGSEAGP